MRMLLALLLVAACGGPQQKKDSSIVDEGSGSPTTCCCKTLPETAEKEITPVYEMVGRMECSAKHGECVDDVQCNASRQSSDENKSETTKSNSNVPPPPTLGNDNGALPR